MYSQLFFTLCLSTVTLAAPGIYDGISYSAHAAPVVQAAPVYHSAPIYQPAPVYHSAPVYQPAPVYHSAPVYHAAPIIHAPQPVYAKQIVKYAEPEPIDPNPAYSFSYGVSDPHTGDHKDAQEQLENGIVHGSYSLVEPDGHVRKVTYTADNENGFNAVVERTGDHAPVAKVAVAPIAKYAVAAPVAKYAFAAPVTKYIASSPGHPIW